MSVKTSLIGELKNEATNTKKILERIPLDKADWKPHEKSMSIGRLATHMSETSHWIFTILEADEYDFANHPHKPYIATSTEDLLSVFNNNFDKSIVALENASDDDFDKKWTVKMGDKIIFELPKKIAIRSWGISHTIHHRGQLSVYLRMLNIPVPGMYGPSADEK
jgi:uncharacterized damage-inducible protein DinB